jgi:dienelactone hydrolase
MQTMTNFTSGGTTIPAELYTPAGTPNGGVIVIAYGSDGMSEPWTTMIQGYANALCLKGFITIIPDYFSKTGTKAGDGLDTFQKIPVYRDTWQAVMADAVTYTKTLPGVDASRVGLLGFSLGGHICLRLRAMAKVLVEFFAPELDGVGAATKLTLDAQIHHGLADTLVFFDLNANKIHKILQDEGANSELCSYEGAVHGFIGADAANTKARKDSMESTLSFFTQHL